MQLLITYHGAFSRSVTPRLVITWEDSQVTPSNEFLVVKSQDRVVRVQEVRVEHNLHAVVVSVEQLHAADLVQDWIGGIVCHVMRRDRRERVTLQRVDTALQQHLVLVRKKFGERWKLGAWFAIIKTEYESQG